MEQPTLIILPEFNPKRASEIVTLVFNFGLALPPNVLLSGTPFVVVKPRVRPGVSLPSILFGQAVLNSEAISVIKVDSAGNQTPITIPPLSAVLQPVTGGVPKVKYEIYATSDTTTPPLRLTCAGLLPIGE